MRAPQVDHRLDGEDHARLQRHAGAGRAEMHDIGLVVEELADAVADEIADHAGAFGLGEGLDGGADIARGVAGTRGGDAGLQRLVGHLDQPLGPAGDFAD